VLCLLHVLLWLLLVIEVCLVFFCGVRCCVVCVVCVLYFCGLLVFVCDNVECWLCFGCIYLFFDVLLVCLCDCFFPVCPKCV